MVKLILCLLISVTAAFAQTDFLDPTVVSAMQRSHQHFYGAMCRPLNGQESDFSFAVFDSVSNAIGKPPAVVLVNLPLWATKHAPVALIEQLHGRGVTVLLNIDIRSSKDVRGRPDPVYSFASIKAGVHDQELLTIAHELRRLGFTIWVKFFVECNGSTFWWTPNISGDNVGGELQLAATRDFRETYVYVTELFCRAGAKNVRFLFHVEGRDSPYTNFRHNKMANLWPGNVVSAIGCSRYQQAGWACDSVFIPFGTCYQQMCALDSTLPIIILEMGSYSGPGITFLCPQDEWWITYMDRFLNECGPVPRSTYPRILGVIFWGDSWASSTTWRRCNIFDEPAASVMRWKIGQSPYWIGGNGGSAKR